MDKAERDMALCLLDRSEKREAGSRRQRVRQPPGTVGDGPAAANPFASANVCREHSTEPHLNKCSVATMTTGWLAGDGTYKDVRTLSDSSCNNTAIRMSLA